MKKFESTDYQTIKEYVIELINKGVSKVTKRFIEKRGRIKFKANVDFSAKENLKIPEIGDIREINNGINQFLEETFDTIHLKKKQKKT